MRQFFKDIEPIFKSRFHLTPNVEFVSKSTTKVDLLGLLVLYKFFEYTVRKSLFVSPVCDIFENKELVRAMSDHNLIKLLKVFIKTQNVPDKYDLQYKDENNLFIAPLVLTREGMIAENDYIPRVSDFYSYNKSLAAILIQCIGEIKSNFKEHAVDDTKSIMMARGNRKEFALACVDTGEGILTSLGKSKYKGKTKDDLIRMTIQKGITSKDDSFHMGRGLWIVSEITRCYRGSMSIYSEGQYLNLREGKIKCGECGFWKGTVFYLNLPLTTSNKTLKEILA